MYGLKLATALQYVCAYRFVRLTTIYLYRQYRTLASSPRVGPQSSLKSATSNPRAAHARYAVRMLLYTLREPPGGVRVRLVPVRDERGLFGAQTETRTAARAAGAFGLEGIGRASCRERG